MTILFGPSPVTLRVNSNPNTSPALAIADDVVNVRATLAHWTGTNTLRIAVELSFDDGVTWRDMAAVGPSTAPSGTFKNRVNLFIEIRPVWKVCGFVFPAGSRYRPGEVCGELYLPGWTSNGTTTDHSDWAHQDTTPLPDLSTVNFHTPDLTPSVGLPLRQLRATMNVSGNVSSQLTVESF